MKKIIIFISLFLFYIIFNIYWLKKDNSALEIDTSIHLTYSLLCFFLIKTKGIIGLLKISSISSYYPPFFHMTTIPFYYLFNDLSSDTACYTNFIYLIILIFATYGISKKILKKELTVIPLFLLLFYPTIYHFSHLYFIDFALTSIVILGIYLLILSDGFNRIDYSILLGIICGMGMLTKWTFIIFLILPVIGIIDTSLIRNFNKNKLLNFLLFLIIFGLIVSLWYLPNFNKIIKNLQLGNILDKSDPSIFNIKFYTYYITCLINQVTLPLFLLFLASFLLFLFKKNKTTADKIILSHIIGGYLILTFIVNKNIRFSMPLLPAVAILSVSIFDKLKDYRIKLILILSLVLFLGYQFLLNFKSFSYKNYKVEKIANIIIEDTLINKKLSYYVYVDSKTDKVSEYQLRYFLLKNYFTKYNTYPFEVSSYYKNNYDYLVTVNEYEKKSKNLYLLKEFKLHDNLYCRIYKRLDK